MKDLLNRNATKLFGRLGYSDARASEAKREAWWWLQARIGAARRGTRVVSGRSVIWPAPGVAELALREVPLAGRGEITVELLASAVSPGTERAGYLRLPNTRISYPYLPGYCGAGVVYGRGHDVTEFDVGELVALTGTPHSSVVTVPAHKAVLVPGGVPAGVAATAYLGAIALHGVEVASIERGSRALVLGAGMIGLLAARIADARGADVVVVSRSRREPLESGGGRIRHLLVDEARAAERFPVVVEATGDPDAITTALELADDAGRVVVLGSPRGLTTALPVALLQARGLELVGAHIGTLGAREGVPHEQALRDRMRAFLELAAAGLAVDDLVEPVDPREPALFYRSLLRPGSAPGAYFDWQLVPAAERIGRAAFVKPPPVRAKDVDPVPTSARRRSAGRRAAEPSPSTETTRFGLVGCGDIGSINADAIGREPSTRLVACYDPLTGLAEDVAARHGAEVARSVDELVERSDVDVVFVCVPHSLHAPLALQAIAGGRHVVVEKPLAVDMQSALEIVEAADRAGVVLSTCFPHRHEASVEHARRLLEEGVLGPVSGVFVSYFADKADTYWRGGYSGRAYSGWRLSREQAGGGTLIMNLCHYVDLVRYVSGVEAEYVHAVAGSIEPEAEVEDTISVALRYADGAVGSFFGTAVSRGLRNLSDVRIWGAEGSVILEPSPQVFTYHSSSVRKTSRWVPLEDGGVDIRRRYLQQLVQHLRTGTSSIALGRDGLAVQAIVEAAYRSAERRVAVDVQSLSTPTQTSPGTSIETVPGTAVER